MSWRVLNISKLRWLTIEYFCLCMCPKSQRFFLKAPWYTLNNYFCEEIHWTSASVFMETWTRRRNRGLWTCSEEPGCGVGAGSACSLPGYLTFSLFLDMAGPPELGRDRLVGEGCSLLFLGSNKLGFFHSSNDQAWRESSLDIFLAACTCLTCWPLASAPELSGEVGSILCYCISSHQNRDMNSSPDGWGPWESAGVKCPALLLQGTVSLLWRPLEDG